MDGDSGELADAIPGVVLETLLFSCAMLLPVLFAFLNDERRWTIESCKRRIGHAVSIQAVEPVVECRDRVGDSILTLVMQLAEQLVLEHAQYQVRQRCRAEFVLQISAVEPNLPRQ